MAKLIDFKCKYAEYSGISKEKASEKGLSLPESYFHAEQIAKLAGSQAVLPFEDVYKRQSQSMAKMFAGKMKVYQPNQISQIALLFYNCIITSVTGNNDYSALRNQYNEQNQVNIDIQHYKKEQDVYKRQV